MPSCRVRVKQPERGPCLMPPIDDAAIRRNENLHHLRYLILFIACSTAGCSVRLRVNKTRIPGHNIKVESIDILTCVSRLPFAPCLCVVSYICCCCLLRISSTYVRPSQHPKQQRPPLLFGLFSPAMTSCRGSAYILLYFHRPGKMIKEITGPGMFAMS